MLTVLTADADPTIAERAQNVISTQPLEPFLLALARPEADPRMFSIVLTIFLKNPG